MGTPGMRVDEGALGWDPAEVTVPAMPAIGAGPDPLSTLISETVPSVTADVTQHVGATRFREERFAANLASARSAYHGSDGAGEQRIAGATGELQSRRGATRDLGLSTVTSHGSAAGVGQVSQFGQLVSMAMQGGQQALQVPLQVAGVAGQLPQGIMQGAQGLVQQFGESTRSAESPKGLAADVPKAAGSPADRPSDGGRAEHAETDDPRPEDDKQQRSETQSGVSSTEAQRAPVESPLKIAPEVGRHRRAVDTPPEVAL